ncbi:hypothetical protein PV10_02986 [Exophiala mesophila]|uniref:DNA repair protein RAD16 n=1 Tax=Exophiala mesophila TaxID=212818 RepID=A0A0D1Y3S0_EXOME|nr:uncharacterized protein PV10_02986 [Exophiala mesophila]KIV95316.1 hypothetical protein PV10_02986 [Exophiala mesophila]
MAPRGRPKRLSTTQSTPSTSKIATPDTSVPPSSVPSRRSTRNMKTTIEIPDSDEPEPIQAQTGSSAGPIFQGVFLPNPPSAASLFRTITAPSSISDSLESSNYDTPATSTVPTPALADQKNSRTRNGATARALELKSSDFALGPRNNNKRKRSEYDEDLIDAQALASAELAAKLQAEEYNVDSDDSDSTPLWSKRPRLATNTITGLDSRDDDIPMPSRTKARATSRQQDRPLTLQEIIDQDDSSDDDIPLSSRSKARATRQQSAKGKMRMVESDASSILSDVPDSDEDSDDAEDYSMLGTEDSDVQSVGSGMIAHTQHTTRQVQQARSVRRRHRDISRQDHERKRLEKAHPEIVTMWDDLKNISPIKPVQAIQPDGISRKLKNFQLEGLDWMVKQEQSRWRGGLLGDEMGMGKTIQAVSLIMSDWPAKEPTLVIVPPVALMQWQAEIGDYTSGKLKVLVYHVSANPKCKLLTKKDLKKYDVIMVSYSGLESMFRKQHKGWNRNDGIVKEDSILHSIKYHRLILDEAHSIKSRTASVAKACFALKADYKWCLSGTPVQNRIGEFFSLLRFLEVTPFACYFCKQCACKQLHWSQDEQKKCNTCKHSGFNHVSVFNQEILNPITGNESHKRKQGLEKLRLITDRIMLRRMKRDHTSSMELPPKDIIIHNEFFGEIERDFSQSIMSNSTRKFDTYVSQGVMLNNYANIFGLIMQMRQVANHPDLILRKNAQGGQNVLVCCICDEPAEEAIRSRCRHEFCRQCAKSYVQSFSGGGGDADCPRCHIPLAIDWDQPEIEQDEENVKKSSIINRIKMEDWTSSTKIEMLVYDLYKLRSKKQTHKSIVFSQFTSMLQLVQWRLQKSGFSTVLLDGSMSPAQRQKSIDYFMNNVDVEVFLVSLKAGGVALNLTEASRVYIVDPWWNPAAEWQSADRCHRIGQRRPCVITRLCIEDSVESRMVLLQEKKANMINGTVNNDQVALDKLTPEDMQFLFRGT